MEPNKWKYVTSLYVGNLSLDVDELDLEAHFSTYGPVTSVRIIRNSTSTKSTQYGYVNFVEYQDAKKAWKELNYLNLKGKEIRVCLSNRDSTVRKLGIGNLFIKNVPPNIDSKSLFKCYEIYGDVISCHVEADEYGISKGYGYVHFKNSAHAERAIRDTNGLEIDGKKLYVAKFLPSSERETTKSANPDAFTNIYIKNFGNSFSDIDLFEKFNKFGTITNYAVEKNVNGQSKGFGFVNYETHESAAKAVTELNQSVLDNGARLFVGRAMKKMERKAYLERENELKKKERYKSCRGRNLYVNNFDENLTEDRLSKEFAEFGEVESVKIEKDAIGCSKCFGYVCFKTKEDAEKAIKGMASKRIDGKLLFVTHHLSKKDRRPIIESRIEALTERLQTIPCQPLRFVSSNGPISMPYRLPTTLQPFHAHFTAHPYVGGDHRQMRMPVLPVAIPSYPVTAAPAFRPKSPAVALQRRGYHANASGTVRQHGHNQNNSRRADQETVNQVAAESQNEKKTSLDDDKAEKLQKHDDLFDKLHSLAQDCVVAETAKKDLTYVITRTLERYLSNNPAYSTTDSSLKYLVKNCYNKLISE